MAPATGSASVCLKSMNTARSTGNGCAGSRTSTPYAVCQPNGVCSWLYSTALSRLCPVAIVTSRAVTVKSPEHATVETPLPPSVATCFTSAAW